jgi:hypothetical protein
MVESPYSYLFGSLKTCFGTNYKKNVSIRLFRSGSGSGRFEKSDSDPVKNRPDMHY